MDIFTIFKQLSRHGDAPDPVFCCLEDELRGGLELYRQSAAEILTGSGIALRDTADKFYSLENNFFSALFLYSFHRGGISDARRPLYAAVNHCLRGMVTGCDNLLDDEYKQTLDTDLPPDAHRFRSVIDIMVSDRVLFAVLMQHYRRGELTYGQVLAASAASLHALTQSGIQEAAEEHGTKEVLTPSAVINTIHHYKTGLLFLCPWGVPSVLEQLDAAMVEPVKAALYAVGLGCQIMDDMADLGRDLRESRHNYLASLTYHGAGRLAWQRLNEAADAGASGRELLAELPDVQTAAAQTARHYLIQGLQGLFTRQHRDLVEPAIRFLYRRIGTEAIMETIDP